MFVSDIFRIPMKVLLDTNIIIHREANKVINQDIGVLFNWLDKLHYTKCIHPVTVEELSGNSNRRTSETIIVKVENYYCLKTLANQHADVTRISKTLDANQNDFNDTKIINEVYCNRVDFLITEDKKLHRKAAILDIKDKVFTIDAFIEKVLAENPSLVDYEVLSVKKEYFGNVDINDSFFDSFREDYHGFDDWFNRKSEEIAYVCYESNSIVAFLYVKVEGINEEPYLDITPAFLPKRRLKIGTFKVVSNGYRIGERFLKIIFDNARQFKVEEIYVTIFNKTIEQERLTSLLGQYGFEEHGFKTSESGKEVVLTRNFEVRFNYDDPKKTYPWLSKDTNVYTIPIKPQYHTDLFPDSKLKTEKVQDFLDNHPYRNSISKSYISHSYFRDLKRGDILVFYRSSGNVGNNIYKGVITTICIVENVHTDLQSLDELKRLCRKRTILSDDELYEYWERYIPNRPFVIDFLYAFSFKKRLTLKELLDNNILPSMDVLRTINKMNRENFTKLISLSGI